MVKKSYFSQKLNTPLDGITFDDVLLKPNKSPVEPTEAVVTSKITTSIELKCPILSAAMDTVTEDNMAIAMAHLGGLGVIHKNMSVEEQCSMIRKVKRSESFIIRDVKTIGPNNTLKDAQHIMNETRITGLPVVDTKKQLVGILTARDLRFLTRFDRKVTEYMTKDVVTVDETITIEKAKAILQKHRIEKLPVVNKKNNVVGLITVKDIEKKGDFPDATRDKEGHLIAAAAVGPFDDNRALALDKEHVDIIFVDCAHAHNTNVINNAKKLKKKISAQLIVGNIATKEAAEALASIGVDGMKVGIGAGSICTTRVIAGIGVPQLTAIAQVADIASEHNIPIIADGGIRFSGDIAKAIAAGADTCMMGNLLAGTKESPGKEIFIRGRKFKEYRGMGSLAAMKVSSDRYFQSGSSKKIPEGVEGAIPYRGPVEDVIYQYVGGLKSAMGYLGTKTIKELKSSATFVKITGGGLKESHPHDILITNESPNYFTGTQI